MKHSRPTRVTLRLRTAFLFSVLAAAGCTASESPSDTNGTTPDGMLSNTTGAMPSTPTTTAPTTPPPTGSTTGGNTATPMPTPVDTTTTPTPPPSMSVPTVNPTVEPSGSTTGAPPAVTTAVPSVSATTTGSAGGSPGTEPSGGGSGAPDATGGAAGASEPPPMGMEPTWIGAWGTAPQLAESGTPSDNRPPNPPGLVNNTLRQVIFPTISGTKVRIELSNGWGNAAVDIQSVHLATAGEGGAIDTATDTPLTFEGSASTTIAAGATAWSDPVDFGLTALTKVAISIHFGASVPTDYTGHPGSRTTSYIQTGDAVSTADLTSGTTTDHWFFITRLDTETTDPASGAVVTFGDSITDGRGSTTNGNNRWPDGLARRLQANEATRSVSVLNMGIGGNAIVTGGLGPTGTDRFERDVLEQSRVRWVIILHGINDIGNAGNDVSPQLISAYESFAQQAQAAGIKVFGAPLLPFANSNYASQAPRVTAHAAVNTWMRSTDVFDGLVDFEAAVQDPANPTRLNTAYLFENDYLHLNPDGYQAMADAIDLTLFQ
jgi:lysophospholipase L1-like esterase